MKGWLSDARVNCYTDRHQQMVLLLSIVEESEDKECRQKRGKNSCLYPKELEVEDTLPQPETRGKQEDGVSGAHVEVKELKSQGTPTRVDFKYVFALSCIALYDSEQISHLTSTLFTLINIEKDTDDPLFL